ncbi:MAG: TRAP transporter small permease [Bernardetiaceae bacterium]|jgi:TRAP-type C4-dicarboxylate transport system permease small subunit|nr:TRAP transporter small permease [Bernardetiaceae bacterium]
MRKTIDFIVSHLLVLLVAVMTLNVIWQVLARYVTQSPGAYTDELAGFLLIWVGMLGAAYATGRNLHLAIDLLPRRASPAAQQRYNVLVNLLIILFAASVMVVGGARLMYLTFSLAQRSAALQLPLGYVYAIIPISGLLIIYYSLGNLRHNPYQQKPEA